MPSHDWFDHDTIERDRRDMRERGHDRGDTERGFIGRNRERSDNDYDRGRRIGGWGGLMDEDPERARSYDRDRYRNRERERMGRHEEDRHFGSDDYRQGVARDETERLIASNKVEGTPVYDRNGDKLGSIHNFMVEKRKGEVVYAVLKHGGGFLGLNERYYPLEWDQLTYDTRLGGYRTQLDEDSLKSLGSFDSEGRWHSRSMSGRRERQSREAW